MAMFRIGQPIIVEHRKPWKPGKPILLRGTVASFDGVRLVVGRQFRRPGQLYDGLPASQEPGDHGTMELLRDAWVCRRRYLRADGGLIGELYNIQTPTNFERDRAAYVDLEIDVAYIPGTRERVQIEDEGELDAAARWHYIPRDLAEIARRVAIELSNRLRQWDERSDLDWDVRPEGAAVTVALTTLAHRWPGILKIPQHRAA